MNTPIPPQFLDKFRRIAAQLSPENLHRDGEATKAQVARARTELLHQWRTLEHQLGRSVSFEEIY